MGTLPFQLLGGTIHTYGGGQILINLCSLIVVPSSTIVINITVAT